MLYRPGFRWARVWKSVLGPAVSVAVEDIVIQVMPAPPAELTGDDQIVVSAGIVLGQHRTRIRGISGSPDTRK